MKNLPQCRRIALAHQNKGRPLLQLIHHLGQQGDQRSIDQDHVVFRVIDHIAELLGEQPNVQGVEHRAHARYGKVGFEMLLVVPLKSSHAITGLHPQAVQRSGQFFGPGSHLGKAGPARMISLKGDDLALCEYPPAILKDRANRERRFLHSTFEHRALRGESIKKTGFDCVVSRIFDQWALAPKVPGPAPNDLVHRGPENVFNRELVPRASLPPPIHIRHKELHHEMAEMGLAHTIRLGRHRRLGRGTV